MEKDKKTKENKVEMTDPSIQDAGTIYELSYILLPTLSADDVASSAESISTLVRSLGGNMISHENPSLIDLAYPMTKVVQTVRHKAVTGFFGWVKFDLDVEQIEKIKKACDENPVILRHLIVKTVRENTFIAGKIMSKKMEGGTDEEKRLDDESEIAGSAVPVSDPVNMTEIGKEIDELVIA